MEGLIWLGHGIFFHKSISCHTYTFTHTLFLFEFQIVLGLMGSPNRWELMPGTYSTYICTSKAWAVCLNRFFLLTSLVTHGPAIATNVCVTRIPWASSVSLFNALRCRAPTAASLGRSWSTRQKAAAQRSHVVSCSVESDAILFNGSEICLWQRLTHRLPFHGISVEPLFLYPIST